MVKVSEINIVNTIKAGRERLIRRASEVEQTKKGVLRAGNTGLKLKDGRIVGKCHNLTLLRFLGIETESPDYSKELMFEAGRRNEDSFVEALKESWTGEILREEQSPISWTTLNGVRVTGRPDIVLARKTPINIPHIGISFADIPKHVIELKLVSSLWTALDVIQGYPKLAHVIQASHYSWQLSVDATLFYTNRTNFALPDWKDKQINRDNPLLAGKLNINERTGKIKSVLPFEQAYRTSIQSDGSVTVTALDSNGKELFSKKTIVTIQGIKDYYEFIATQVDRNTLGPIPENLDVFGEPENWKLSDYCPAGSKCCMFIKERDGQLNNWIQQIQNESK